MYNSKPSFSLIAAMKAYEFTLSFSSLTIMISFVEDQALELKVLKENTASSIKRSLIS